MISVSAAKALIAEHTHALPPVTMALEEAAGCILAEDVYARYDIPAFRQSSMDGYALKFQDRAAKLKLIGVMAAGTYRQVAIKSGETSRIFTGAPLPEGADTVVMQEKIRVEENTIILQDTGLKRGTNVREKGAEIKAGDLAIRTGATLTPAAIGFLAGIGIEKIRVFPMPKVIIIVTGNELQQPGQELGFAQVYESNSYSLTAALKAEGVADVRILHAKDDLELLISTLDNALSGGDLVLLTGGVSVGDYDFVVEASARCGIQQIFHKIKQKPGKPLYFGKKGGKLIFGLPGNPSSVLSCYYNYVLPCLKLLSRKENSVKELTAELTHSCNKAAGLTHFLKGNYQSGKVTSLNAQESFRLSSFAQANCLICLEEERTDFEEGQTVTILLLPI